jgi:plasmid stabilization system protein ParE
MEKEIVWTSTAENDFWDIVTYLKAEWPVTILNHFHKTLLLKIQLLAKQPNIGYRSNKYSKFRKTLITRHYMLIYTIRRKHIIIHRLKHTSLK